MKTVSLFLTAIAVSIALVTPAEAGRSNKERDRKISALQWQVAELQTAVEQLAAANRRLEDELACKDLWIWERLDNVTELIVPGRAYDYDDGSQGEACARRGLPTSVAPFIEVSPAFWWLPTLPAPAPS